MTAHGSPRGPDVHSALKAVVAACAKCDRPRRLFCETCTSDEQEREWRRVDASAMSLELLEQLVRSSCSDANTVPWALPRALEAAFLNEHWPVHHNMARFVARGWPLPPSVELAVTDFVGALLDEALDTEPPTKRAQWTQSAPASLLCFASDARLTLWPIASRWLNRRSTRATTHLSQHVLWNPAPFHLSAVNEHLHAALERAPDDVNAPLWREAFLTTGG